MVATEELKVLISTQADVSGAKQAQQALQQLSTAQQGANAMLRAAMAQQSATMANYATTARSIRSTFGTAPTLGPGAFGIAPPAAAAAARAAANQRTQSALSFKDVAAAAGIGTTAQQLFHQAVQLTTEAVGGAVNASREHERVIRATGMAYGQAAGQFQEFSKQLEATTGFTSDAILEAALSARTLSQNYGLTIQQTQKLITVSADLARVRGIGIAESFERVQSAIRGEAEASEYLGLTLNDTYLTNQAMNGSLKTTFGTMTDVQKAQVRYNELLKQSQQFAGLAAGSTDSLDAAFTRAESSGRKLQIVLGDMAKPAVVTGLKGTADAADLLARALERAGAVNLIPGALGANITVAAQQRDLDAERKRTQEAELKRLRVINEIGPRPGEAEAERARQAAERTKADQQLRRLREVNELPSRDNSAELARVALMDQLQAAMQDVVNAQDEQLRLQQESVQLSAAEAQARLSMLPAQQQMAELQRDITEQQLRARSATLPATEALQDLQRAQQVSHLIQATNTSLQEQQIRARMAALPAVEALEDLQRAQEVARLVAQTDTSLQQNMLQARLAAMPASNAYEDLQYEQQRQQLISRDRTRSAGERSAARRELRELNRQEPGVALSALEAQRGVTGAARASERADIQQQMVNLADQAALATAQLAANQAQQGELEAKRAAERASLDQQLKDLAEQASLAVAQLAVIEAQRAEVEAGRAAERFDIAAQLQAIADARALAPVLDAAQANQLQQTIAAAVLQGNEQVLQQMLGQVKQPIMLSVNITHADGRTETYTELIEANAQAVIPPAIQLSGLRRG